MTEPLQPRQRSSDDRRWTLTRSHPMTTSFDGPRLALGESVEVVPVAEVERLQEAWEKDNLCGVCPYRKAVQAENDRLRESLEHVANWKEFFDRNVGAWDVERYGRLTIGTYARAVLDGAMGWSR